MKRAIAKGAAWMLLFKLAERSLSFISVIVLARLLVPADFGLVAMAISVIAFVELAGAFGFDAALIQREHADRRHYDTAWTLQVAFGAACAALTAALALPTASFYDEPRLVPVMLVLGGGLLIQSFENIGIVEFRRSMDFAREVRFLFAKKFAGFLVAMTIAFAYRSYWALIAGTIASRAVGLLLSYGMQAYRPRFTLAARRDLFSFSGWMFAVNVVAFAGRRVPHFVIGRLYGAPALGLYTVGSEIAQLPATDMIAPMSRAIFPGYARLAADPPRLRETFLDILSTLWIFGFPACFGVAAVAEPLVYTMLGSAWGGSVVVVQILAIACAGHAMTSNHFSAWLALGKPRVPALTEAFHLAVLVVLMATFFRSLGLVGVAYAELGATVASITLECVLLCRAMQFSSRAYLSGLWRPLAASILMAFAVSFMLAELERRGYVRSAIAQLGIGIFVGILVYFSLLAVAWLLAGRPRGAEVLLLDRLAELAQHGRRIHRRYASRGVEPE